MKVKYIAESAIPSRWANSVHALHMCSAFSNAGAEVTLLSFFNFRVRMTASKVLEHYGIVNAFQISRLPLIGRGRVGRFLSEFVLGLVASLGHSDLVVSRSVLAAWVASRFSKDTILELHHVGFARSWLTRRVFEEFISNKNSRKMIVVITEALKVELTSRWPEIKPTIAVLPDAAAAIPASTEPTVNVPKNSAGLIVGYIGQLHPGKGIELILKIAKLRPGDCFEIVGGDSSEIEGLRQGNFLPENVRFHGQVPPSKTAEYLLRFDVALVPNQPSVLVGRDGVDIGAWTSPLKLFEYMAAGKAILCSDLKVLREVVKPNEHVLFCSHADAEDWARALEYLEDSANREALGSAARGLWRKEFSWDIRAQRVLAEFGRLT